MDVEKADRSVEELAPVRDVEKPVVEKFHEHYKQARDYAAFCSKFSSLEGCTGCPHRMVEQLMMCRWWNRLFWGRDKVTQEELKENERLLKESASA